MSTQHNTIIGRIDFSIDTLKQLKSTLHSEFSRNKELSWAIGGIVATLTGSLLKICSITFKESLENEEPDAKEDLRTIQNCFHDFIDELLEGHAHND